MKLPDTFIRVEELTGPVNVTGKMADRIGKETMSARRR